MTPEDLGHGETKMFPTENAISWKQVEHFNNKNVCMTWVISISNMVQLVTYFSYGLFCGISEAPLSLVPPSITSKYLVPLHLDFSSPVHPFWV